MRERKHSISETSPATECRDHYMSESTCKPRFSSGNQLKLLVEPDVTVRSQRPTPNSTRREMLRATRYWKVIRSYMTQLLKFSEKWIKKAAHAYPPLRKNLNKPSRLN